MAILDPRLLPLVEMLTELGMDWLAFELAASLDALEKIVAGGEARPTTDPAPLTTIVLRGGDREHTVGRAEVEASAARLSGLSEALAAWLRNARSDRHP